VLFIYAVLAIAYVSLSYLCTLDPLTEPPVCTQTRNYRMAGAFTRRERRGGVLYRFVFRPDVSNVSRASPALTSFCLLMLGLVS
jgi:hypothetical protein